MTKKIKSKAGASSSQKVKSEDSTRRNGATSILAVSNQKGGVGKTTTVINLASAWAMQGKKVCVIDTDYQANATVGLGASQHQKIGEKNLYLALNDNEGPVLPLDKVVAPTNFKNIDIVAACDRLNEVEDNIVRSSLRDVWLEKLLSSSKTKEYDIIIIDTHPTLSGFFWGIIARSHYYIVPCFPEEFSAIGLHKHMRAVESIRENLNPMLKCLGILISNINVSNKGDLGSVSYIEEVLEGTGIEIFDTFIPTSTSVRQSHRKGQPLCHYSAAKSQPIAHAYACVAKALSKELKGKRQGRKFKKINCDKILSNENSNTFLNNDDDSISLEGAVT